MKEPVLRAMKKPVLLLLCIAPSLHHQRYSFQYNWFSIFFSTIQVILIRQYFFEIYRTNDQSIFIHSASIHCHVASIYPISTLLYKIVLKYNFFLWGASLCIFIGKQIYFLFFLFFFKLFLFFFCSVKTAFLFVDYVAARLSYTDAYYRLNFHSFQSFIMFNRLFCK